VEEESSRLLKKSFRLPKANPRALKRGRFKGLAARLKSCPSQKQLKAEFFGSLLWLRRQAGHFSLDIVY